METQREELDTLALWDRWEAAVITFSELRGGIVDLVKAMNWYARAVRHGKTEVTLAVGRIEEADGALGLISAWHRVRDLAEKDGVRVIYRDLDDDDDLVVMP